MPQVVWESPYHGTIRNAHWFGGRCARDAVQRRGAWPLEKCRRPSVKADPHEPLAGFCQTQDPR
jgi:hypothetical protein